MDWEKNGLEVIGEASNGEEALTFFDMNEPDLVITDIDMPFMDGVTLAEKVRKRSKECHIIMLTGYSEFEYARKSIVLGVDNYLLKPINADELTRAAVASKEKIEFEKGNQKQFQNMQKEAQTNQLLLRDAFFQRVLERRITEEETEHKLHMFRLANLSQQSICVNIHFRRKTQEESDKNKYCEQIMEWIKAYTTAEVCFMHYMETVIAFFSKETPEAVEEQISQIFNTIAEMPEIIMHIGISKKTTGVSGIAEAYQQTQKAISVGMIIGEDRCLHYDEYEKMRRHSQETAEMNWKEMDMALAAGNWNRMENCIEYFCVAVSNMSEVDENCLRIMVLEVVARASTTLSRYGKSILDFVGEAQYYKMVNDIHNKAQMEQFLKNILKQVFDNTEGMRVKKEMPLIGNVKKFVAENLSNPELGLRLVSKELFVNGSYLSRIFKQEVGESLTEYITRNRIEKSIQLLDTTDMRAYEIADEVGIKDAHYFSICFKKYVGVTIKEYKNRS